MQFNDSFRFLHTKSNQIMQLIVIDGKARSLYITKKNLVLI